MKGKRILIVGGVAGGASCAARARRLDEGAEIVLFERGEDVSFANCGLPYYIGGVIREEQSLHVASPELLKSRFNIDVRTRSEVTRIDRARCEIEVKSLETGEVYREPYAALVLAPGAAPIRPAIEGVDLPGVFTVRNIPDSRAIRGWIDERHASTAVVVGAGFIGLELAENLAQRGIKVAVLEMLPQVMPPLDPEMAEFVSFRLIEKRVDLRLDDAVSALTQEENGSLCVKTNSGKSFITDMAILSVGVRPESTLAKEAGLATGVAGAIQVDENMRTNDPKIWAVGDAVEVTNFITGEACVVPLAGPANRQGRVAADSICGRTTCSRGVQGTAVCGAFGLTIAMTGASEKLLRRRGVRDYEKVYLHPDSHAAYYPGATPIHMKLLFSRGDGKILGAQAVGEEGVERRIDVIAMAIQMRATVFDLEEAELCYAPQFGSAKDPVNLAGMAAANVLRGDVRLARWEDLSRSEALVVDVREPLEYAADHVDDAINIPLGELRERLSELPQDREIFVCCGVGQRSYYAARVLTQRGFQVKSLSGGMRTYSHLPEGFGADDAAKGTTAG